MTSKARIPIRFIDWVRHDKDDLDAEAKEIIFQEDHEEIQSLTSPSITENTENILPLMEQHDKKNKIDISSKFTSQVEKRFRFPNCF